MRMKLNRLSMLDIYDLMDYFFLPVFLILAMRFPAVINMQSSILVCRLQFVRLEGGEHEKERIKNKRCNSKIF